MPLEVYASPNSSTGSTTSWDRSRNSQTKGARKYGATRNKRATRQTSHPSQRSRLANCTTQPCPVSIASKKTIWGQKSNAQCILNHELLFGPRRRDQRQIVQRVEQKFQATFYLDSWTHSTLYIISVTVIEQQTKNSETLAANPRKRRKQKKTIPNIYYKGFIIRYAQKLVMFECRADSRRKMYCFHYCFACNIRDFWLSCSVEYWIGYLIFHVYHEIIG
jgi:hypothetical protein